MNTYRATKLVVEAHENKSKNGSIWTVKTLSGDIVHIDDKVFKLLFKPLTDQELRQNEFYASLED